MLGVALCVGGIAPGTLMTHDVFTGAVPVTRTWKPDIAVSASSAGPNDEPTVNATIGGARET
jgi:hypothetical protein